MVILENIYTKFVAFVRISIYVSIECIPINNGGLGHCMNAEESDHLPEEKKKTKINI